MSTFRRHSVHKMQILDVRESIQQDIFDYQTLLQVLDHYNAPRDRITGFLTTGEILRIRKGLYCFSQILRRSEISREYLANIIHGPSYVSLDYALSYYGLIPERVESVTSLTLARSRRFITPFGVFEYKQTSADRYRVGFQMQNSSEHS